MIFVKYVVSKDCLCRLGKVHKEEMIKLKYKKSRKKE